MLHAIVNAIFVNNHIRPKVENGNLTAIIYSKPQGVNVPAQDIELDITKFGNRNIKEFRQLFSGDSDRSLFSLMQTLGKAFNVNNSKVGFDNQTEIDVAIKSMNEILTGGTYHFDGETLSFDNQDAPFKHGFFMNPTFRNNSSQMTMANVVYPAYVDNAGEIKKGLFLDVLPQGKKYIINLASAFGFEPSPRKNGQIPGKTKTETPGRRPFDPKRTSDFLDSQEVTEWYNNAVSETDRDWMNNKFSAYLFDDDLKKDVVAYLQNSFKTSPMLRGSSLAYDFDGNKLIKVNLSQKVNSEDEAKFDPNKIKQNSINEWEYKGKQVTYKFAYDRTKSSVTVTTTPNNYDVDQFLETVRPKYQELSGYLGRSVGDEDFSTEASKNKLVREFNEAHKNDVANLVYSPQMRGIQVGSELDPETFNIIPKIAPIDLGDVEAAIVPDIRTESSIKFTFGENTFEYNFNSGNLTITNSGGSFTEISEKQAVINGIIDSEIVPLLNDSDGSIRNILVSMLTDNGINADYGQIKNVYSKILPEKQNDFVKSLNTILNTIC